MVIIRPWNKCKSRKSMQRIQILRLHVNLHHTSLRKLLINQYQPVATLSFVFHLVVHCARNPSGQEYPFFQMIAPQNGFHDNISRCARAYQIPDKVKFILPIIPPKLSPVIHRRHPQIVRIFNRTIGTSELFPHTTQNELIVLDRCPFPFHTFVSISISFGDNKPWHDVRITPIRSGQNLKNGTRSIIKAKQTVLVNGQLREFHPPPSLVVLRDHRAMRLEFNAVFVRSVITRQNTRKQSRSKRRLIRIFHHRQLVQISNGGKVKSVIIHDGILN
mmetsp:Transcript_3050/g.5429  ORF Transcript_3050/g.5429 Transcript_3050/m.5429 type:complete len:275 (-) Transcript_3050:86-910(-)